MSRGPVENSPGLPVWYCRVKKAPTRSLKLGKSRYVRVPRRIRLREMPSWWSTMALRSIPPMLSFSGSCLLCLRAWNPAGLAQRAMSSTPPFALAVLDFLLSAGCLEGLYVISFSGMEPLVPLAWPLGSACIVGTSCRPQPACACSMIDVDGLPSDSGRRVKVLVRSSKARLRGSVADQCQCSGILGGT